MPNDVINTITLGNTTYNIGGSGHTIEKSDGTDMTQRANLQFVDATVTDDSANDRTKIENVKTITNESELDDLPDGIYIGPTDEGLPFDAGDIPYDNTESGLSADSVQEAIDEIDDIITTDETIIEGNPINFSTLSAQNAVSTIIDLEPIQDLHRYDKPWVGGAGKNLLGFTEADIMSLNSGVIITNHQATVYGAGFTFETDSNGYINKVIFDGTTPTNNVTLKIHNLTDYIGQTIIINGSPSDGSTNVYFQAYAYDGTNVIASNNGNDSVAFNPSNLASGSCLRLVVKALATYSKSYPFYPMVRLSTVSDNTFEPYENICPISGRTEIGILGCGKNLLEGVENGTWTTANQGKSASTNRARSTKLIKVESSTQYCISAKSSDSKTIQTIAQFYSDIGEDTFISETSGWENVSRLFTTPENCKYIAIIFRTSNNDNNPENYMSEVQLEKSNQVTDYSPYTKSNDLTISLGQTVYGGTLDVENGVLVCDNIKRILNDDSKWATTAGTIDYIYNEDFSDRKLYESSFEGLSSSFVVIDSSQSLYGRWQGASYYKFGIKDTNSVLTLQQIKDLALANKLEICYKLSAPIIINLTPHQISLLECVNNISTTGDKITLTYRDGKMATLKDIKDTLESSKPVYSTVETAVGTYLNKPLYSKTYQIQFSSSNSYYFDVPSAMDIKFVFGGVYSTRFDFIPFGYGGSGGDMVQCYRFSDTQFRIQNAYYASRMYCDVTLQYTKSTD